MAARSPVERADVRVAKASAGMRRTWPVRLLGFASEVADQPPLIASCAATLAIGLLLRDRRLADTGGRMLAAELVATGLKSAVKANVDRTRPHVVADGGEHRLERGGREESAWNSFPSGHTAGAVAVARAVRWGYPALTREAASAAAAIAVIQIPRCKHYPSDILAGAAIGVAAEMLVSRAAGMLASMAAGAPSR